MRESQGNISILVPHWRRYIKAVRDLSAQMVCEYSGANEVYFFCLMRDGKVFSTLPNDNNALLLKTKLREIEKVSAQLGDAIWSVYADPIAYYENKKALFLREEFFLDFRPVLGNITLPKTPDEIDKALDKFRQVCREAKKASIEFGQGSQEFRNAMSHFRAAADEIQHKICEFQVECWSADFVMPLSMIRIIRDNIDNVDDKIQFLLLEVLAAWIIAKENLNFASRDTSANFDDLPSNIYEFLHDLYLPLPYVPKPVDDFDKYVMNLFEATLLRQNVLRVEQNAFTKMVVKKANQDFRKSRREVDMPVHQEELSASTGKGLDSHSTQQVSEFEDFELIRQFLNGLSNREAEAFELIYKEHTYKETAGKMGLGAESVKTLLSRARLKGKEFIRALEEESDLLVG